MSLLGAEPTLYPETLLDPAGPKSVDRQWMVVYTKARQEKALARDLLRREVPFYLPVVKRTAIYRGRRRTRYLPLFSGYVFLYGSEAERIASLTTNHISRVLAVSDAEELVRELRNLRQLIAADAPLTVESRLAPGRRVRVRQGAFAGIEGTVLVRRGETRLLVSINFLQQGASVEIDDFQLEPID
jgi:transcriptional antiterminator RfaH